MDKYFISQSTSLALVICTCLFFTFFGVYYSRKFQDLSNYLTANRSVGLFSLTTSLTASALGAWILFGPVSASTWGGIGSIIGYSLGTAFPMFFLIFLGKKIRKEFPKGSTLVEFLRKKFGQSLFKLILLMMIFYMFIFLCAEVTAISVLINYISGTPLWLTAFIVLLATLTYTLYGGLRASLFTDNIQMILVIALLIISFFIIKNLNLDQFSFKFISEKNTQRFYAAKNFVTLKKSLIFSFFIIIPIVFYTGFVGMVAFSIDPVNRPDLGFFSLLLKNNSTMLSLIVIILGLALTISTVDTLVNAISSLIVVDGKAVIEFKKKKKINYLKFSKYVILILSLISFFIASKGFDILYLFLLADLFCCAFVFTIFYSFFDKRINEKTAYFSIIIGLIGGLLLFPSPDFSKSLLVGFLLSKELFTPFINQSLLFVSFLIATFLPLVVLKLTKFK